VVAFVVPTTGHAPSESELRSACASALARFKHPRRYMYVDQLPRNTMGKVQKHTLRH